MVDEDRMTWLETRRAAVRDSYDEEASTYDAGYDPATPVHRRFVAALVATVPAGGALLDAACGTAPYAGIALDTSVDYVGVDQSTGMLRQASRKWPTARFEQMGLQELAFDAAFHAVMCIDAMENVPPEAWPGVVGGFARALSPGGHAYLTVEEIDQAEIDAAHADGTSRGWPIVHGEVIEGDTAGYHFYPGRMRVLGWLADAGFQVIEQEDEWLDGYGYHHLFLRLDRSPR